MECHLQACASAISSSAHSNILPTCWLMDDTVLLTSGSHGYEPIVSHPLLKGGSLGPTKFYVKFHVTESDSL